jgi:hypothetical protein
MPNTELLELATKLADDFHRVTKGKLELPYREDASDEPDTSFVLMRDEFIVWTHEALDAYTEWLASEIFRSQNYQPRELPEAPPLLGQKFAQRYGRPDAFIWAVSVMLKREDRTIPLLGKTVKRILTPDEAVIRQWASFYTWA